MNKQAKELTDIIKDAIQQIKGVTPEAVKFAAQPIMDRADEIVPEDTGKLRRSAFLETDNISVTGIRVLLGYARFGNPSYAAFVHERVDIRHAKGKSAKFLEIAVNEKIFQFKRRLVKFMREFTNA